MNINPFKRIADLEAKLEAMEADYTKRFIELTDYWHRVAKVEKQAAAAMATASTSMDVMTKLPSIAVMEQALEAVKILDMQVDNLMSENKARKVGAEHLSKLVSVLQEDLLLLKASRNVVTQVRDLEAEMDARKESANYLHDYVKALDKDVALLKALRNVVTPEEVSRKTVEAQIERDRAKQREYNAAYRARQKAKAEAEAKKARQREYKRAWTARKKAALAAAQEAAK